jgi:hypothetical protein
MFMKRRLPGGGWTDDPAAYRAAWERLAAPVTPPGWTLKAYDPVEVCYVADPRQVVVLTPGYCRAMAAWRNA